MADLTGINKCAGYFLLSRKSVCANEVTLRAKKEMLNEQLY